MNLKVPIFLNKNLYIGSLESIFLKRLVFMASYLCYIMMRVISTED